jgi:hypothetical protein
MSVSYSNYSKSILFFKILTKIDFKKSLVKTQLHQAFYFNFIILFFNIFLLFYFFHNSENIFFSHSPPLSPFIPIVYSPPLPFFFFFITHIPHFFLSFSFFFPFFFPTTHVPPSLSFYFSPTTVTDIHPPSLFLLLLTIRPPSPFLFFLFFFFSSGLNPPYVSLFPFIYLFIFTLFVFSTSRL